jgi:CheY-like chemotaxis protein
VRILFLDDDKARHQKVREGFIGNVVVYALTYDEAVAALTSEPFDVAYLDYDLVTQSATVEKTGFDVARHIATLPPEQRPRRVVIHSVNEVGQSRMADVLSAVGCPVSIKPFNTWEPR